MKHLLPISFIVFFCLVSCVSNKPLTNSKENSESNTKNESGIIEGEVKLNLYSLDKTDSVESSIQYMFYESIDLPYQDSINRMIKEYVSSVVSFGEETMTKDSDLSVKFMEAAIDKFAAVYYEEMALYDDGEYFGAVWNSETVIEIHQENPEFTEVSFFNWDYSGGAHGNSWSEYLMLDTKTAKELKLSDFFSDVAELTSIAEVIFRADQEISPDVNLEETGFWFDDGIFVLNENFVFNENSIDFLFNPYEIAPYSAGLITLSIPLKEVEHLLKRKVKF